MTYRAGRSFLHTPGPTHVPESVLNAMRRQPLDLSDPEFVSVCNETVQFLKPVFATSGNVLLYAANGHGGWEALLTNLLAPGDKVLVPETGHFGAGWAQHGAGLGLEIEMLPGDWRQAIDPQRIEDALRADTERGIQAVLATHIDTGTGILSNIKDIRAAIDATGHPALLLVDAVASLGAIPFCMDEWGIDGAVSASQKALMSPPGLAIIALNPAACERSRNNRFPRVYWDWQSRISASHNYTQFGGTAPQQTVFALHAALKLIEREGLPAIFERHRRLAGAVQAAVAKWVEPDVLSFNAKVASQRAATVTTILTPEGYNSEILRNHVRSHLGVALGGGLGKLEGKAFRIGHMGDLNEPMILGCLAAVETGLIELAIPHGEGGLRAAAEFLAAERIRQSQAERAA